MGTIGTGPEDGTPAGGVGTITRPAPRRVPPQRIERPRPVPRRRGAPGAPGAPGAQPGQGAQPGHGAPAGHAARTVAPSSAAPGAPAATAAARHTQRMPFFLLLCVMLGGALICALVISTTLAAGSYRITRLQQANDALARQRQVLQDEVATAQSAQSIQQRALQLGMRPVGELRFLNLKTGQTQTDAGTGANADIHVPGYTP